MMRDTDKDWSKLAAEHPYWSVLSEDRFRGRELAPDVKAVFYASGEAYIRDILSIIRRQIDPNFAIRRGLDFGCGVGRLLLPIARMAREAVGVDVAPRMLDIARRELKQAGIANASVVRGDDQLSLVPGRFNFVSSFIVLQHIPPERGMLLINRLVDLLETGGVFNLHLTYARVRRFLQNEMPGTGHYRVEAAGAVRFLGAGARVPDGAVSMFDYDLNEVMLCLTRSCGPPIMLFPTDHAGHIGAHLLGMRTRG